MARVITQEDWILLGLPGRRSYEIVSKRGGVSAASLRFVEIPPADDSKTKRSMHRHLGVEEFIWVIDGRGIFKTPDSQNTVTAGQVVYVPAGELHVTQNVGQGVLHLLCFFPHNDIASVTEEPTE